MSATTANAPAPADAPPMTHTQILQALSGLLIALFIATLSSTVVSTALPRIIGALHGSQVQYTWVVTATLLTATATTPIWGKLADLFSKQALVQTAIIVFVVGSVAAGFSQDASQLIAARALQGIGVGGLQALVQIAIGAMISPRERGRYSGYLSISTALSTIGGPLLGGLIVDTSWLGWRWCFFIGVPIAAVALVVIQMTLRLPTISRANVKIDYLGAALIAAGVSLLLVWISFVGRSFAWGSWQTAAMVGGVLVLLGGALFVEAHAAEPVIPLDILRQRTVLLAILGSLAVGTALYGSTVFLSQYFQVARGYSPTEAGLLTIPMMAGILVSSIVGGSLLSKVGRIKPFIVIGAILLAVGFAGLGIVDHQTSLVFMSAAMLLVGIGVGLTMQNFVLIVQNVVALKDMGAASSTVAFFRSLGGTIGVSVLGAVLARQVTDRIVRDLTAAGIPATGMSGGSLNVSTLPPAIQQIVQGAYGDVTGHIFMLSAGIALLGILAAVLLPAATLRTSLDLPDAIQSAALAAEVADGAPAADTTPLTVAPSGVAGRR